MIKTGQFMFLPTVPSTSGIKRPRNRGGKKYSDSGDYESEESDADSDELYSASSKTKRQRQNQARM